MLIIIPTATVVSCLVLYLICLCLCFKSDRKKDQKNKNDTKSKIKRTIVPDIENNDNHEEHDVKQNNVLQLEVLASEISLPNVKNHYPDFSKTYTKYDKVNNARSTIYPTAASKTQIEVAKPIYPSLVEVIAENKTQNKSIKELPSYKFRNTYSTINHNVDCNKKVSKYNTIYPSLEEFDFSEIEINHQKETIKEAPSVDNVSNNCSTLNHVDDNDYNKNVQYGHFSRYVLPIPEINNDFETQEKVPADCIINIDTDEDEDLEDEEIPTKKAHIEEEYVFPKSTIYKHLFPECKGPEDAIRY